MGSRSKYRQRGQQLIEITCGLLFLIPIFLFLFDIAFMYFATNLSDGVARDAARAAANTEPETAAATGPVVLPLANSPTALARARAVVLSAQTRTNANGYIRKFEILDKPDQSLINITGPAPEFGVPSVRLGGPWGGTVRVRTKMTYVLPVSIPKVTPDELECEAEAQFPLTTSRIGTDRNLVQ
ncbi:MAG: hypothetical protein K2W95_26020 [Candidatus Obscuribacterales bacterium]|nr:hypothetical protein [Candidatus Obscuribacterales bacterium]